MRVGIETEKREEDCAFRSGPGKGGLIGNVYLTDPASDTGTTSGGKTNSVAEGALARKQDRYKCHLVWRVRRYRYAADPISSATESRVNVAGHRKVKAFEPHLNIDGIIKAPRLVVGSVFRGERRLKRQARHRHR